MPTVVSNRNNPNLVVPHLIVRTPLPAGTEVVRRTEIDRVEDLIACVRARVETLETWKTGVGEDIESLTEWQNVHEADLVQAGMIMLWPASSVPAGWLVCDGSLLNRADYPDIFAAIGVAFNIGGETALEFRLPNFAKRFVRGYHADYGAWGTGANLFAGSTAAPVNVDVMPTGSQVGEVTHSHNLDGTWSIDAAGSHNHTVTIADHNALTIGNNHSGVAENTSESGSHYHYLGTSDPPHYTGGSVGNHAHLSAAAGSHYHTLTARFKGYVAPAEDPSGLLIWNNLTGTEEDISPTSTVDDHQHTVNACVNGYTADVDDHQHSIALPIHTISSISSHSVTGVSTQANHTHSITKPSTTASVASGAHTHIVSKVAGWDSETKPDGIWMNFIIKR